MSDRAELLSRHLDGDLTQSERRVLKQRLDEDPALRRELEELQVAREAVRLLAARERAPDALDERVAERRRSGARPPRGWRPALQALAVAATVVIGATVVLTLTQRRPLEAPRPAPQREASGLEAPATARPATAEPVPSQPESPGEGTTVAATGDRQERPLGAIEHLLASPPPAPALDSPPPLNPQGPLDSDPDAEAAGRMEPRLSSSAARKTVEEQGGTSRLRKPAQGRLERSAPVPSAAAGAPGKAAEVESKRPPRALSTRLEVVVDSGLVEMPIPGPTGLQKGRHTIVVTVAPAGTIASARPIGGEPHDGRLAAECRRLAGLRLPGVPAGTHPAALVVGDGY